MAQLPRELSDDEFAQTAALKELHQKLLGEFDVFVIELYKAGMIPGWRALLRVEKIGDTAPLGCEPLGD